MTSYPPIFAARIREHNRSCWLAAAASLGGAWLSWLFVFAIYSAAVLLFETVRTGDVDLSQPPFWYLPVGLVGVVILLVWAGVLAWQQRYRPPSDRAIIGWHVIPDFLLLPARMTFAIWNHIGGRVVLSKHEKEEAWQVLQLVFAKTRAGVSTLTSECSYPAGLNKLLTALQVTGWIDLHRGEDDWFYRVLSDQEPLLRKLLAGSPEETSSVDDDDPTE